MTFIVSGKNYSFNVSKVFENATEEDYRTEDVYGNGVRVSAPKILKAFKDNPVILFYDTQYNVVNVYVESEKYVPVRNVKYNGEEFKLIKAKLSQQ